MAKRRKYHDRQGVEEKAGCTGSRKSTWKEQKQKKAWGVQKLGRGSLAVKQGWWLKLGRQVGARM